MSCIITEEQGRGCLVFNVEADCDAALVIQNAGCAECGKCSQWARKQQRPDGKWWFFKHPDRMTGIEGVLTYSEENYSDAMKNES